MGLGGEVDEQRRPLGLHELRKARAGHVHPHRLDEAGADLGEPALVARVGVGVDVQHRLPVARQRADERRADEAQPAGDEHTAAHATAPRLCSSAASSMAGSA